MDSCSAIVGGLQASRITAVSYSAVSESKRGFDCSAMRRRLAALAAATRGSATHVRQPPAPESQSLGPLLLERVETGEKAS